MSRTREVDPCPQNLRSEEEFGPDEKCSVKIAEEGVGYGDAKGSSVSPRVLPGLIINKQRQWAISLVASF